jgi:hypothetical protein
MKIKFKFVKIYFYILLTISSCILFLGDKNIDAYGALLLILGTFTIFGILYKVSFNQFSDGIENKRPKLFSKYKTTFGVVRRINRFELLNNSDFEKLDDKELIESLKLTKQLFGLTIISFFVIIILGISFMLTKR